MKENRLRRLDTNYLRLSLWLILFFWIIIILTSFIWNYFDCQQRYQQLAGLMADTHFDKEKALRLWVASRGGVYVSVDERNPPNPLLQDVEARDIILSDKSLTLVPGFHLVRQLREEFPDLYKVRGDTVSLNPLRKENSPDEWQKKALESFQAGGKEVREFAAISCEPYLRMMRPHYAQKDCLKCHGKQGYKEGDILGGVEVSLPVRGFLERQKQRTAGMVVSHGAIFAVGLIGIVIGIRSISQKETARNAVQRALINSEEKYRHLVEGATDIIYQTDRHGSFTFLNAGVLRVFGYSEVELIGRNYLEFVAPSHREVAESFWKQFLENRDRISYFECPFVSKNGSNVWLGQNVQSITSGDDIAGFQAIARDMTKRRQMEENLKESEQRYRSLYSMIRLMCDNVPDLIWAKDLEGKYLFVNRAICERLLIAKDTDEPIGKTDMHFVERERTTHPNNPEWHTFGEICIDSDAVVIKNMKDGRFNEFGNVKGRFLYLDVYKTPLWNEHGEMIGVVGSGRDVTEEKRIKDSLQESESRYRELFHYASDLIYTQEINGNYTSVNQVVNTLLGYTEDEFLKLHFRDIVAPETLPIVEENFFKKIRDGIEITGPYEALVRSKNGTPIWLEIKSRLIKQGGNPVGIHGIARNITDRKALEKALVQAQATYHSVVGAFDGIIHISSPDHVIEFANQRLIDRTGYDPVGEKCFKVVHGLEEVCPWCKYGKEDPEETFKRERFSPKDNRWYYAVSSPFYHEDGSLSRIFLMHDLDMQKKAETERENLREQLLQAQKIEAVGTLAGGIAHDFNNLLQMVLGYSELMLQNKKEGETDYVGLHTIHQAGKRGADLVKGLLTFSRKVETKYVPVNLNQEITHIQSLLSRTIPKTIKIDLHLDGDLESILADPSQLGQVLMNLGVNARDAMPDSGTLTIATSKIELDEEYCSAHPEAKPGRYILLAVSDTGQGMDKETVSHIFEPFFTTKERGKGTGLGLAIVYGIVKQHNGHIICHSEPGHGTTFKVYLPAIQTKKDLETPKFEMTIPGGSETVLLVDDEEVLRDLGATLLNEFGYKVITACNGKEALEIYRKEKDRISLILLDLIMPVMDGMQSLSEILGIDATAKVVIASGYSDVGQKDHAVLSGAKAFVQKPYDMRQLLTTIRDILDERFMPVDAVD